MNYVRKICPTCGSEFLVLEKVKEKAIYCTLGCLLDFEEVLVQESGLVAKLI